MGVFRFIGVGWIGRSGGLGGVRVRHQVAVGVSLIVRGVVVYIAIKNGVRKSLDIMSGTADLGALQVRQCPYEVDLSAELHVLRCWRLQGCSGA